MAESRNPATPSGTVWINVQRMPGLMNGLGPKRSLAALLKISEAAEAGHSPDLSDADVAEIMTAVRLSPPDEMA